MPFGAAIRCRLRVRAVGPAGLAVQFVVGHVYGLGRDSACDFVATIDKLSWTPDTRMRIPRMREANASR